MVTLYFSKCVDMEYLISYLSSSYQIKITQVYQEEDEGMPYYSAGMDTTSGDHAEIRLYTQGLTTDRQNVQLYDFDPRHEHIHSLLEIDVRINAWGITNDLLDKILMDLGGGYRLEDTAFGRYISSEECRSVDQHSFQLQLSETLMNCAKMIRDPNYRGRCERAHIASSQVPTFCDDANDSSRLSTYYLKTGSSLNTASWYEDELLSCAAGLIALAGATRNYEMCFDVQRRVESIKEQLAKIQHNETDELRTAGWTNVFE